MIVNPAKLDAAFYTFDLSFRQGLETVVALYPKICKQVSSPSREMRYAWAANVPGFRLWQPGTERVYNNISGRVYTLTNNHYEDSIEVSADDINDDQLGIYQDSMNLLGVNAGAQPDVLVFNTIELGLTTGYGYDGVPFFSTAHPISLDNPGLGTYSNLYTTAGSGARPLNAANFSYIRSQLQARKLENGLPLALGKLTLTVPTDLRTTAEQLMNLTMFAPASAYGAVAAQASDNVLKGAADIVVSPYLTNAGSDSVWYLSAELGPMKPFVYQVRQPARFIPLTNPTDYNVFTINMYRYGADVRNIAGYSFPQLAIAAGG
jgi:phage major head subunit gpT-like protein